MQAETITEFAGRYGLSRATLLYYDRIGLLKPAGLSPAGYRLYGERERLRMARIQTYRRAGLPLKAIRELLDEAGDDVVEMALEHQLRGINEEIARLRSQQALVLDLLRRRGKEADFRRSVDVGQWVAMLEEAGVDEQGQQRWHAAFERDAPEAHQAFLETLGLAETEIAQIRRASRERIGIGALRTR